MSERSQARRHPDDTRCQNEVRRKSDDVRPSLRAGSPFNTNLGDCTSSHSFLSTHAHVFRRCTRKGTLLSFPPLSFFHSNPAECLEQGAWPQKYLSPLINSLVSSRFHVYIYHYTMTVSLFQRNISLYSIIYQPDILKPMLPPPK